MTHSETDARRHEELALEEHKDVAYVKVGFLPFWLVVATTGSLAVLFFLIGSTVHAVFSCIFGFALKRFIDFYREAGKVILTCDLVRREISWICPMQNELRSLGFSSIRDVTIKSEWGSSNDEFTRYHDLLLTCENGLELHLLRYAHNKLVQAAADRIRSDVRTSNIQDSVGNDD